jgi:cytochrome c oxidase accessory protein FixG
MQSKINRLVLKKFAHWPKLRRDAVANLLVYSILLAVSVFLSFVFIAYFVEPRDLLNRLMRLDIVTAGGIAGAVTTLLTFLDFAFLRQRFCTTICPYGYLQGMLADDQTLLVHYRDPDKACIECKKCVRVCHMGIDIRKSPYQIECIHCGECIDACDEILARLKNPKPGLIHYTWGEQGETTREKDKPWWFRLGFRDAKRVVVMLVLLFYASGITVALAMRRAVQVRISPIRETLYTLAPNGDVLNKFKVEIANRSPRPATVNIRLDQLAGARIIVDRNPVEVAPGQTLTRELDISAARQALPAGVSHFNFIAESPSEGKTDSIPMTFIMPQGKGQ